MVLWPVMAVSDHLFNCRPKRGPSGCDGWLVLEVEGQVTLLGLDGANLKHTGNDYC